MKTGFAFLSAAIIAVVFGHGVVLPPPIPQLNSQTKLDSEPNHSNKRKIAAFFSNTEWLNRCSVEIDSRIQGKTASTVLPWRDDTQYLSSSWAYGLNLTAVAIARGAPRGVAVTPRHLVSTKHYGWHPWPGQTVRFLTMDNRIISRVVDKIKYLGSENNTVIDTDVAVIRLTEDLPGSISPMKLIAKDGLTDVAQYSCPVLRIDQENKALLVAAYTYFGTNRTLGFLTPNATSSVVRIRPYAPYYEDMITGDSTSSSIIVYRDQFGVTPFLLSQVTYGGAGSGPNHAALASEIQGVIDGFGDTEAKYKLVFGPFEYAGHKAPRCSISANRVGNTGNCSIAVQGSGDSTNGNPSLLPSSVSSWTKSGNIWSGTAACSTQANTTFTAQLTGPGGTGVACESGEVKALITLPGCTLSASRQGTTNNCTLSVTRTQGNVSGNPVLTPVAPSSWNKSGEVWSSTVTCSQTTQTNFSATLSGPEGTGSACTAIVPAVPRPVCVLSANRQGSTDVCNISVTRSQGEATGNPTLSPANPSNWTRSGDVWNGTALCSTTANTNFSATIAGPGGTSSACTAQVNSFYTPPTCSITAAREGSTSQCNITVRRTSGTATGNPTVTPSAPSSWTVATDTWTGKASCPTSSSTVFSATLAGPAGTGTSCAAATVPGLNVAPSCRFSGTRRGTTSVCDISITIFGQSSGTPLLSPAPTSQWTQSGNVWSSTASCAAGKTRSFNVTVTGPYGKGYCGGSVR